MSFNRERLTQKFLQEYEKLNEQQQKAVDTIEGPVMVIAGPGTGKTQILASRIGRILLDTDTSPDNILCLTYTEAGVVAMRKRLLSLIGPDAYKVNIYTFHAFCNDIIQENLSLFEKTALHPVSDLEKIEMFKELIDTIRVVPGGGKRIPPEIASEIAEHATSEALSVREIEVLMQVAGGNANKRVAALLGISEETVKAHMKSILSKLSANDRTHAVTIALKRGIIDV